MLIPFVCSFGAALFGLVIGSFLNVLIFRIPKKEEFVKTSSHCMSCGHKLAWYDLFPLFSWLLLRGKCRYCKSPISKQYPLVELFNAMLWFAVFALHLFPQNGEPFVLLRALLLSLLCSSLLALSVIDFRTFEIPVGFNIFIAFLGFCNLALDLSNWKNALVGTVCISIPLLLILLVSKGKAIGGGDVKLMAACGFMLGWQKICFAFLVGCILGSVIHIIRMRIAGADRVLAMGPYLSLGIVLSLFLCDPFVGWYTSLLA